MANKRKPNPYALATEQANARAQDARLAHNKAVAKAEKGAGLGLKKMLAARASAAIAANVAAPSVVLGNALAMAAGVAPLDVERLGIPLPLTLDQRKALPKMLSDARLPGKNWEVVLQEAFEQPKAWAPQKSAPKNLVQEKPRASTPVKSVKPASTGGGRATSPAKGVAAKSSTPAAKKTGRSLAPAGTRSKPAVKTTQTVAAPQVIVRKKKVLGSV